LIGHAGLTIFDDTADMLKQARFAMEFCAIESCGKCTPVPHRRCARRGNGGPDRAGDTTAIPLLTDLCATMKAGSLAPWAASRPIR
jgi:formate dehydrogenase iron-sulfur subunit